MCRQEKKNSINKSVNLYSDNEVFFSESWKYRHNQQYSSKFKAPALWFHLQSVEKEIDTPSPAMSCLKSQWATKNYKQRSHLKRWTDYTVDIFTCHSKTLTGLFMIAAFHVEEGPIIVHTGSLLPGLMSTCGSAAVYLFHWWVQADDLSWFPALTFHPLVSTYVCIYRLVYTLTDESVHLQICLCVYRSMDTFTRSTCICEYRLFYTLRNTVFQLSTHIC